MAGLLRTKTAHLKTLFKLNLSLNQSKCKYHIAASYYNYNKGKVIIKELSVCNQIRLQSTQGLAQTTNESIIINSATDTSLEPNSITTTEINGGKSLPESPSTTNITENQLLHAEPFVNETPALESASELIPEPPPIPEFINEELLSTASDITVNLSTSLASQGLGGWYPPGIMQECLNYIHVTMDLPWFLAIFTGTLVVRILLFPLVIKGQKNAAHMTNHMPQVTILQQKMTEARRAGNPLEAAQLGHELMAFMKEKNVNPLKTMLVPLIQAPIFLSFFIGLRQMANLPMESMKDGGIYWFTNLTVPDPYYLLPIMTTFTLLATIELGADGFKASNMALARYVIRALPFIMLPFTIHFPSAVLCYWLTSNVISLGQVGILKIPVVREFFKIPLIIPPVPGKTVEKKGFVASVKESMKNAKITRELDDRLRVDEMQFKKSGLGPIPKTYSYNPTKQNVDLPKKAILVKRK